MSVPDPSVPRPFSTTTTTSGLAGTTALVTGAARGFGRATAAALAAEGAQVVGIGRDGAALERVRAELGERFTPVVADVTDDVTAGRLVAEHEPRTLVLNAGAAPLMRPIHQHTWETFAAPWETDARQAFTWVREALLRPLSPGSTVVSMSSGAAVFGSPWSGGYAGAKAAVRFVSAYAAGESARLRLGIRFVALLPKLTPDSGEVGRRGVAGYAEQAGADVASYVAGLGPTLTADQVGTAVAGLATAERIEDLALLVTPEGITPLG
jgi:NAD(P)-dependent dehydrogenase (short-subunit alcohol dehydrogenase family)